MEKFFLASGFFDEIEIKELLLRRYHSLDFINDFELSDLIKFIKLAREKEDEERLFDQWCALYPFMGWILKPIDYEQYKEKIRGANVDMRPKEMIIEEIKNLHAMSKEGE